MLARVNDIPSQAGTLPELFARAAGSFGSVLSKVTPGQWADPTPCADWDVRALVSHVVSEVRWAPELLAGRSIPEIEADQDAGFLAGELGADAVADWAAGAQRALSAVHRPDALAGTARLSYGEVPARDYVDELMSDLVIHRWDLARTVGADERIEPDLLQHVAGSFASREDAYREAGVIGPKVEVGSDADDQARLLATFGRDPARAAGG
jgi:uncharacterized protein (TIGR03086 family)